MPIIVGLAGVMIILASSGVVARIPVRSYLIV